MTGFHEVLFVPSEKIAGSEGIDLIYGGGSIVLMAVVMSSGRWLPSGPQKKNSASVQRFSTDLLCFTSVRFKPSSI
jgi:hypothetical protein